MMNLNSCFFLVISHTMCSMVIVVKHTLLTAANKKWKYLFIDELFFFVFNDLTHSTFNKQQYWENSVLSTIFFFLA